MIESGIAMKILDQEKMERIKALLKTHPRGLSITHLASITKLNRNLIAKYLDMLVISGQVEIQQYGPAKVYFPSHRIPVSAMIEITSDLVMVLDQERRIIHVNEPFARFLGLARERLVGKNIGEMGHPFLAKVPLSPAGASLDPGDRGIVEVRYPDEDGGGTFRIKRAPAVFEDGSVGLTLIIEDITEQRRYEEELRKSQELQHAILNASPVGIGLVSDHLLVWANEAMYRIQGILPGELKGKPESAVFAEREEFEKAYRELYGGIERQGFGEVETVLKRGDGSLRNVHIRAAPIEPGSREIIVVVTDITARKKTEAELRTTQALQEAVLRAVPVGIGLVSGRTLQWENDAMCRMLGIKEGDLKGQHLRSILADEGEYERVTRELDRGIEEHGSAEVETIWRRRDGSRVEVALRVAPIQQGSQDRIGVASDITDRNRAEKALRESEETFRTMVSISPLPLALIHADGRYLHLNPAFTRLFGYTLQDIPDGRSWFHLAFPDGDKRAVAIRLWKADAVEYPTGEIRPRTFQVRCKDGSQKDILFLPASTPAGLQVVVYQDLTLENLRGRLRDSEERYRHLVEDLNIGIYRSTGDPGGRFIWGNTGLVSILGYEDLADLQGVPIRELFIRPEGRKALLEELKEKRFVKNRLFSLRRKNGTPVTVSVTALADFDEKGALEYITGLVQEISEKPAF